MGGFIEAFEAKVVKTVRDYRLVDKSDKVVVACSGGKDSTTVLYILNKLGYDVEALTINLLIGKWSEKNLENVKRFCKELGVRLHVLNIREKLGCSMCYIRTMVKRKVNLSNCTICGVIKRWLLNRGARELGATKLATGHNLDDEAETILMSLLKGNPRLLINSGPKSMGAVDGKFVPRIKPLYFLTNKEVERYSRLMKFPVLYEPCPCLTESAFRRDVRGLLAKLERENPEVKMNIVENFSKILRHMKGRDAFHEEQKYCKACGEPSRNEVCKACEMMGILKNL